MYYVFCCFKVTDLNYCYRLTQLGLRNLIIFELLTRMRTWSYLLLAWYEICKYWNFVCVCVFKIYELLIHIILPFYLHRTLFPHYLKMGIQYGNNASHITILTSSFLPTYTTLPLLKVSWFIPIKSYHTLSVHILAQLKV